MKTLFDHIDHIKSRPHHVRRRIAFATAAAGASFVALIWFFGVVATGTFALKGTSFADSTGAESSGTAVVAPSDSNNGLAGAAAAVPNTSAPGIEIVDAPSATPAPAQSAPTVIPF